MDLEYNIKYSNKSSHPCILYLMDAFTRYKCVVFITDKKTTTVIDAFWLIWWKSDIVTAEEWMLVAYAHAATKNIDNACSVAGYIVLLLNTKTNNATPLTLRSKKVEIVVNSS